MLVDDALLPAAAHLTGGDAFDVLAPVVAAAGGELLTCEPSGVQYRPESDLVVRYRCTVARAGVHGNETLLAATTRSGPPRGTVPVEATTSDGTDLRVGVWRWPFDPVLTGLTDIVTPHLAGGELGDLVGDRPALEVVAYRPTERAVVRVRDAGREMYVKVVPPTTVPMMVSRHERLVEAGVPVPRVLAHGEGWVALEALVGTTLRDRLKHGVRPLPSPDLYGELLRSLATVDLVDAPPVRSRVDDAPHHAAMLATVLPDTADRLARITDRLAERAGARRAAVTVHGDLHEAQLVVDDGAVTGLLDIDDAGPGDPLDDIGTLIAHLRFRAATSSAPDIDAYASHVRAAVAADHDPAAVDRHVAAVLVGLATGPFRIQQPDWRSTTLDVLDLIETHLDAEQAGVAG